MTREKRTKAELLNALEVAHCKLHAVGELAGELRRSKASQNNQKVRVGGLEQSFEAIRQSIKAVVAVRFPQTVAFGSVETIIYRGEFIHPGYEGDNEEVRLLQLIDDKCQEALRESRGKDE